MSQAPFYILLKLLSGLNAGAEMELAPGDWVVGSDEESQLLILDAGVSPQHLLLHVEPDGGVTLLPKNGTALVGGKALPPEGAAVQPFEVFTIGGTHMAYGPAEGVWPELSLPSLVAARPAADESAPSEKDESAEPAPESQAETSAPRTRVDTANNVGGNKVGDNKPSLKDLAKTKFRAYRRPIAIGLACVLLLGLVLDYTQLGFIFTDTDREAASLAKNLHRRGFAHVTVTPQEDGSLLIRGAVPSNNTLDALVGYVERTGKKADMSIISLEDLTSALAAKAKRLDAPLRISRVGFKLLIRGYAYDMLALEDILKDESEALSMVPSRLDVITWDKAAKELRAMITARRLENKVRLLPDLYRITLQSQPLTQPEQQSLMTLLREMDDYFGVEGLVGVERWRVVAKAAPRKPQNAKTMIIQAPAPGALDGPIRFLMPPAAAQGNPGAANPAGQPPRQAALTQGAQSAPAQVAPSQDAQENAPLPSGRGSSIFQAAFGRQQNEVQAQAPASVSAPAPTTAAGAQERPNPAKAAERLPSAGPGANTIGETPPAFAGTTPAPSADGGSAAARPTPVAAQADETPKAAQSALLAAADRGLPLRAPVPTPAQASASSEAEQSTLTAPSTTGQSPVSASPSLPAPSQAGGALAPSPYAYGADAMGTVDLSQVPLAPGMGEGLGIGMLPSLTTQPQFTCAQLRLEGEGPRMAVIYGGVRYRRGAKLPGDLQVKLITPTHVVLQRGKTYTRICAVGEIAKEKAQ